MRIEELEDIIGLDALGLLIASFGGTRLYIPSPERLKPDHKLCLNIGDVAAAALSAACGGEIIDLPVLSRYQAKARHKEIIRRRLNGESINTVAKETGCTNRLVVQVWQKYNQTSRHDANI